MNRVWWEVTGKGNCRLVLIHGWGLNTKIWHYINAQLTSYFTLYLVDLPGFGYSYSFEAMDIREMAEHILQNSPSEAVWLGWSLGGLVASQIALMYSKHMKALITVASSPCFQTRESWPGIKPEMLTDFQYKLNKDLQKTIEYFFFLQVKGTKTARDDIRKLKSSVLRFPIPNITVLNNGLEILKNVDLRKPLSDLVLPHLRIYGNLDSLVPYAISAILDKYWPNSQSFLIKEAAHALFLSHPKEFCNAIISFSRQLR